MRAPRINWYLIFRVDICPCRHCRRQCIIFASGVNFSRKQHFSRIKTEISSSLIYLCFFSKTCWIRSFLTKICLNYLHLCINTIKTWVKNVANYFFYRCRILGLKIRVCKKLDKYHVCRWSSKHLWLFLILSSWPTASIWLASTYYQENHCWKKQSGRLGSVFFLDNNRDRQTDGHSYFMSCST